MIDNLEHGWVVEGEREAREPEPYTCAMCGMDIEYGEEYYEIDGEKICCDCIDSKKRRYDGEY